MWVEKLVGQAGQCGKAYLKKKTSVQNDNVTFMLNGIYIQGKKKPKQNSVVRNEIIMIT